MPRQILIVTAVFLSAFFALPALGLPMPGPAAVVLACAAAVLCLRGSGEGWPALGLSRQPLPRTLLLAVGCAVLGYLAAVVAVLVTTGLLGWPPARSGGLGAIQGNLPLLLGMLAIAWTSAAFGEELLFRGFLQGRLQAMWGGGKRAGLLAALVQSLAFGLAHAYQGPTGIVLTGCIGLVFGLLYLRLRSLWPLVIAHGLIDTLSLVALYAGVMPG